MTDLKELKLVLKQLENMDLDDWDQAEALGDARDSIEEVIADLEKAEREEQKKREEAEKNSQYKCSVENQVWLYKQIKKMVENKSYSDPGLGITHAHLKACLDRMLVLLGTTS